MKWNLRSEAVRLALLVQHMPDAAYSAQAGRHVLIHAPAEGHNYPHLRSDRRHTRGLDICAGPGDVLSHSFAYAVLAVGRVPLEPRFALELETGAVPSIPLASAAPRSFIVWRCLSVAAHFCTQSRPNASRQQESDCLTPVRLTFNKINGLGCMGSDFSVAMDGLPWADLPLPLTPLWGFPCRKTFCPMDVRLQIPVPGGMYDLTAGLEQYLIITLINYV